MRKSYTSVNTESSPLSCHYCSSLQEPRFSIRRYHLRYSPSLPLSSHVSFPVYFLNHSFLGSVGYILCLGIFVLFISRLLLLLSEWENSKFCIHTLVPHSLCFIVFLRRSQTFQFRRLYFHPVLYLRTLSLSLFPLLTSCKKFVETPRETPLDGSITGMLTEDTRETNY